MEHRPLRVLDLCSGIGGFSLAARWAGMRTVAFAEIDPYCRNVLAHHWPGVPCYDDITKLTGDRLRADGIVSVDIITAGFPCQDISCVRPRQYGHVGIHGHKSRLFFEIARLVDEVRPRWIFFENVSVINVRGLDTVLSAIDALGYIGQWHLVPAAAVGAPHQRDRWWFVGMDPHAYRKRRNRSRDRVCEDADILSLQSHGLGVELLPTPDAHQQHSIDVVRNEHVAHTQHHPQPNTAPTALAAHDRSLAIMERLYRCIAEQLARAREQPSPWAEWPSDPILLAYAYNAASPQSSMGRVADGLSHGLDARTRSRPPAELAAIRRQQCAALHALGNAIVPQVAAIFLKAIVAFENG